MRVVIPAFCLSLGMVSFGCTPAQYGGEVHCPGNSQWDGQKCVGALEPCPTTATNPSSEPPSDPVLVQAGGSGPGLENVVGDFVGDISVNGRVTTVETHLRASGGAITGDYRYSGTPGQFTNCQLSGAQLSCTWIESNLTGTFRVQYAADGNSFSGGWEFSDGSPGGSWNGRRRGSGAAPPPPPPPPPTVAGSGSVNGTYRGSIGVGGRLGPVVTRLSSAGGVVSGDYSYSNTSGQFSNCRLAGPRLSCTWTEGSMTGGFRVEFSSDKSRFSGSWDYSNGAPGGSWDGRL